MELCYCSDVPQSSGNYVPKCLPFSILCAKSVIIHTSIACILIKTGVGVNCNWSFRAYLIRKKEKAPFFPIGKNDAASSRQIYVI